MANKYGKGEELVSKMVQVFDITEENAKESIGKTFVIKVVEIVDEAKKSARILVLDNEKFAEDEPIMTFIPTVIMNYIKKNKDSVVGGEPIVCEYVGLTPFADGKSHFGRKTFHNWKFFEAVAKKTSK